MNRPPFSLWSAAKYVLPVAAASFALAAAILTPVYAYDWYQLPFIGAMLEPTLVVNNIDVPGWPALEQGVRHPDHLIVAAGQSVEDIRSLERILENNASSSIPLTFQRMDGESVYTVIVQPQPVRVLDMVRLFLIPYAVGLAFLITGLWAFRVGYRHEAARAFLLFAAAASVGIMTLFDMRTTHHLPLAWILSIPVAGATMIQLALVFPEPLAFVRRAPMVRAIPWLAAGIIALPSAREYLNPTTPWAYIPTWLQNYAFVALAIFLLLITLLVRSTRSSSAVVRQQSRIIVFGAALGFGPILVLFLLPAGLGQPPEFRTSVLIPPLLIFPLSFAYSIVRYRLLDVDRLLGNGLTYALTMGGALTLFYLLLTVLSFLLQENLNASDPLVVAVFLLLVVTVFNPLRAQAERLISQVFYRHRANYRVVLSKLSRGLVTTPDIARTLGELETALQAALNPERLILYLYDDEQGIFLPFSTGPHPEFALTPESALVRYINRRKESVWFPPGLDYPPELIADSGMLNQIACQAFVPLVYESKLIGLLALGARRSGEPYSSDDLDFLSTVAGQSALAVEVARLFGNLARTLSETREMKNLMDDIFASMPSGVITTDLQQKITLFNQAAERILGIQVSGVIGKPLEEALPPLWPALRLLTTATLAEGRATLGQAFSPEMPNGKHLHLRISLTPLLDAQAGTKGATILIDDLTEKIELEKERERIRQTFGRVVAPRVRDRLLNDPRGLRLDGAEQTVTVLFADLHNFTSYSEQTPPEELFETLNSYLSLAAQAVLQEEGTLDKFMGDAVMAIWNAPDTQEDHTLRAVRAALAIEDAIRIHRAKQAEEHQLYFSTGITRGPATVGNVGTAELFNYTAIGDTVNLAQRLESIAEPGQILLSEAAYLAVKEHIIVEEMEPVEVKGKAEPVKAYVLKGYVAEGIVGR